tara:strand:- start:8904 stop:9134 length:231 start_codon:yes stop_codon:yes gene_type:complete
MILRQYKVQTGDLVTYEKKYAKLKNKSTSCYGIIIKTYENENGLTLVIYWSNKNITETSEYFIEKVDNKWRRKNGI